MEPAPLLVIAGPTGSGKSELALAIAEATGGEIVNCDSVQVYRGFDVGAAKLTLSERRGVPHHLIDVVEPDQPFTAGDYARAARVVLRDIAARGRLPIVAGGTGFYLRALLDGLSPGPARDAALRERLTSREGERPGSLHRLLVRLDPEAGRRIHARDLHKTTRALELRLLRGAPAATLHPPDPLTGFAPVKIGLSPDRSALYARLDARLAAMFQGGLLEEVRSLLARGVSPRAKPFESLGYKQALQFLDGELGFDQALEQARVATRHYAKRQLTWFRRERDMHWVTGFGADARTREKVAFIISDYLRNQSQFAP